MQIRFDSQQQYQLDAVQSVVDLFSGQTVAQSEFEVRLDSPQTTYFSQLGFGNQLELADSKLLSNLQTVQQRNDLPPGDELDGMNFSIEMETGTGKTYVYLRTIHELHRKYGFTKFIIVVPSVAIREGVLKNIELTRQHFADLYDSPPLDSWIYDSRQVSRLRQFATSNQLQILILNIDAFNKAGNVMNREDDRLSGHKPIEFIQSTNPILVIDEPQNMESEQNRAAITSLNPLLTLRYSATHREQYNLVYKLDPLAAYDLKLVKRIEVASVLDEADFNKPYINLKSVRTNKSGPPTATLEIDVQGSKGPVRKTVRISRGGVDLFDLSGDRANYKGYIVDEINTGWGDNDGWVRFTNGLTLHQGQTHGGQTDDITKVQILETVREHLEKEAAIQRRFAEGARMKILSLFFIDRVANYVADDGKIKRWFEEAYRELSQRPFYASLNLPPVEDVHKGYFAESRGKAKDSNEKRTNKDDDEAYTLIMKDKERLLQLDTPLRFIFSHSALREGWDNPNVFQICTLNESKSEMRKRQEIGRGLRLPVLETGERCQDPNINCLTVIANESYADFARQLQSEIEQETGVIFGDGRIKNRRERRQIRLKDRWRLNADFQELWERINKKTRYSVEYATCDLINLAAREIGNMPRIRVSRILTQRAALTLEDTGVATSVRAMREDDIAYSTQTIPDLLGYLQRETNLTRSTLAQILIASGRLDDVAINPQQFMDQAVQSIRDVLHELMIDGIKYEPLAGEEWEMLKFEEAEIIGYLESMIDVNKSIYDSVLYDSDVEKRFAQDLDLLDHIRLFLKLPNWFTVETPMGTYNPDWAIVKQHEGRDKLYLVSETKGTMERLNLRGTEAARIICGKAHFDALNVEYRQVTTATDL